MKFDLITLLILWWFDNLSRADKRRIIISRMWLGFMLDAAHALWEINEQGMMNKPKYFTGLGILYMGVILAEIIFLRILSFEIEHPHKGITVWVFKVFSLINSVIMYNVIPSHKENISIALVIDAGMNCVQIIIALYRWCNEEEHVKFDSNV